MIGSGAGTVTSELILERLSVLAPVALIALLICLLLTVGLRPWIERYALARPNARSSHRQPTAQGGGIAVVIATLAVAGGAIVLEPAAI